nr:unnamed protein product [Digitaria exilis]
MRSQGAALGLGCSPIGKCGTGGSTVRPAQAGKARGIRRNLGHGQLQDRRLGNGRNVHRGEEGRGMSTCS